MILYLDEDFGEKSRLRSSRHEAGLAESVAPSAPWARFVCDAEVAAPQNMTRTLRNDEVRSRSRQRASLETMRETFWKLGT